MAEKYNIKKNGIIALAIVLVISALASVYFFRQHISEPMVEGPGITRTGMLSDHFEELKGTEVDTKVYYLEGKEPGPTMLINGGTHPCEPGTLLMSVMFLENAIVEKGRLIVIPRAQETGYDQLEPGRGYPPRFHIKQDGDNMRWFRMGNRIMDHVIEWPAPTVYVHWPEGQTLASGETLNLNRNWPGRANGRVTEKLTHSIVELVKQEEVDIFLDPHEAPPDRPLVNAICAHQDAIDLATMAVLNMEMNWGLNIRLEISPENLHGISHREVGDYTDALAVLHETASPMHGPIRGKSTEKLLLDSKDELEMMAHRAGRTFTDYSLEEGWPISVRVARHVQMAMELTNAWNELNADQLVITNMPTYDEIVENGMGNYLAVVDEPEPWLFPIPGISEFFFNQGRPFWGYSSNWTYDKVLGAKEL